MRTRSLIAHYVGAAAFSVSAMAISAQAQDNYTNILDLVPHDADQRIVIPDESVPIFRNRGFSISKNADTGANVISIATDADFALCRDSAFINTLGADGKAIVDEKRLERAPSLFASTLSVRGNSAVKLKAQLRTCEAAWTDRLNKGVAEAKIKILGIDVGQFNIANSGIVADIVNFADKAAEVRVKIGNVERAISNLKDLANLQSTALSGAFRDLSGQLITSKKDLGRRFEDMAQKRLKESEQEFEIRKKQFIVNSSAEGLALVAKLAFSKDPVTARRIEASANSISKIANSVIKLSSSGALAQGAKAALTMDIASGALALMSMFGPQNNETSMMAEQLQGIREDISALRQHMDDRFDRVEEMIIAATKHLDAQLKRMDQRLDDIEERLKNVDATLKALYGISTDAFAFLIAKDFTESLRICEREITKSTASIGAAQGCIEKTSVYGREGSNRYAVSSGATLDISLDIDQAAARAGGLPDLDRVGYLDAVLRNAERRGLIKNYKDKTTGIASPPDWAVAVDFFSKIVSEPEKYEAFKRQKITRERLVDANNYGPDITDLVSLGEKTMEKIAVIRKHGVTFALQRLEGKLAKLADIVGQAQFDQAKTRDLGILGVGGARRYAQLSNPAGTGGFRSDGTTRYSIRFYDEDYLTVTAGPQTGRVWQLRWRATKLHSLNALMAQHQEGNVETAWTNYINQNYAAEKPGFTTIVDRSVASYQANFPEINEPYLDGVNVRDFMPAGNGALRYAQNQSMNLPAVKQACEEAAQARKVVDSYAWLMRTSTTDGDQQWIQDLEALPGRDAVQLCRTANLAEASGTIKEAPKKRLQQFFSAAIAKLKGSFMANNQAGGMDTITTRIQGLRTLAAPAPAR